MISHQIFSQNLEMEQIYVHRGAIPDDDYDDDYDEYRCATHNKEEM
jgi:hypothetical protein